MSFHVHCVFCHSAVPWDCLFFLVLSSVCQIPWECSINVCSYEGTKCLGKSFTCECWISRLSSSSLLVLFICSFPLSLPSPTPPLWCSCSCNAALACDCWQWCHPASSLSPLHLSLPLCLHSNLSSQLLCLSCLVVSQMVWSCILATSFCLPCLVCFILFVSCERLQCHTGTMCITPQLSIFFVLLLKLI